MSTENTIDGPKDLDSLRENFQTSAVNKTVEQNVQPVIPAHDPELLMGVENAGILEIQEMRIDPSAEAFGGLMGAVTSLSNDVYDAVGSPDVAVQQPTLQQPTHNIPTLENNTWTPQSPGMMG